MGRPYLSDLALFARGAYRNGSGNIVRRYIQVPAKARGCKVCSCTFYSKRNARFCSPKCRAKWRAHLNGQPLVYQERNCITCGVVFVPGRKDAQTCSRTCHNKRPKPSGWPKGRSRWSDSGAGGCNQRRAKRFGCVYTVFNPFVVFERDGWVCKLCGCTTPKELRGTTADNAPELDHVVPMSKGGPHTLENTQCTCRKCNRQKRDKVLEMTPLRRAEVLKVREEGRNAARAGKHKQTNPTERTTQIIVNGCVVGTTGTVRPNPV